MSFRWQGFRTFLTIRPLKSYGQGQGPRTSALTGGSPPLAPSSGGVLDCPYRNTSFSSYKKWLGAHPVHGRYPLWITDSCCLIAATIWLSLILVFFIVLWLKLRIFAFQPVRFLGRVTLVTIIFSFYN